MIAGDNDTGDKFMSGINDTAEQWSLVTGHSEPGGHWIVKKNLKLKILCQTPFKGCPELELYH